jgi:hypothetical protein
MIIDSTLTMTAATMGSSPVLSLFGTLLMSFMTNSVDKSFFSSLVPAQYLLFFKMFSLSYVTLSSVSHVSPCLLLESKDIFPKSLELLSLQRLCKKISGHVVGSVVLNWHVSLLNLIGYKEVTNV